MNTQMKTLNSSICRILFATFLSAVCLIALSTQAATITVTNTNDSGSGSLRQAVADAFGGDTINFSSSLNGQTIMLTSGVLLVDKSVTISGPGANTLAVDANHASRVFHIASGQTVTISGLSITNGLASTPVLFYAGGGIYNDNATLTVSSCAISGNSTPTDQFGNGGGIFNDGYSGGAVLTVSNCTISSNSAVPGTGGGITNYGYATVTIANSTFSGNTAQDGGGIYNYGNESTNVTVDSSTLSGNSAAPGYGGGISNTGTVKIGNTILNAASSGVNIRNLVLGTVISLGYNLSSDNGAGYLTAAGDRINTDPQLGPLQDNGGPTFTHLPAANSPAIDAGDSGTDQRGPGFSRMVNRIDIGAVEAQATPTPTPKPHGHH